MASKPMASIDQGGYDDVVRRQDLQEMVSWLATCVKVAGSVFFDISGHNIYIYLYVHDIS